MIEAFIAAANNIFACQGTQPLQLESVFTLNVDLLMENIELMIPIIQTLRKHCSVRKIGYLLTERN